MGILTLIGNIAGGLIASKGAKEAGEEQAAASREAAQLSLQGTREGIASQEGMFGYGQELLRPDALAGRAALVRLLGYPAGTNPDDVFGALPQFQGTNAQLGGTATTGGNAVLGDTRMGMDRTTDMGMGRGATIAGGGNSDALRAELAQLQQTSPTVRTQTRAARSVGFGRGGGGTTIPAQFRNDPNPRIAELQQQIAQVDAQAQQRAAAAPAPLPGGPIRGVGAPGGAGATDLIGSTGGDTLAANDQLGLYSPLEFEPSAGSLPPGAFEPGAEFTTPDPYEGFPSFDFTKEGLENDPGYQKHLERNRDVVMNDAAARGLSLSGRAMEDLVRGRGEIEDRFYGRRLTEHELDRGEHRTEYDARQADRDRRYAVAGQVYGSEVADRATRYGREVDQFNAATGAKNDVYNRLASLAGTGQVATRDMAAQGAALGSSAASLWANSGNTLANLAARRGEMSGAATASSAGILGTALASAGGGYDAYQQRQADNAMLERILSTGNRSAVGQMYSPSGGWTGSRLGGVSFS